MPSNNRYPWHKSPIFVIALLGSAFLILPFIQPIIIGAVFAVAFAPLFFLLVKKTNIPKSIWLYLFSILFTLVTTLSLASLAFLGTQFGINEAKKISKDQESSESISEVKEILTPDAISETLAPWLPISKTDLEASIRESSKALVSSFAKGVRSLLSNVPWLLIALISTFVGFFATLKYGNDIQKSVLHNPFLDKESTEKMLNYLSALSKFLILSSLAAGAVQTSIMGITCVIADIDQIFSIMVLIFFFSFVPFIGTTPVALAVVGLQLFQGNFDTALIVLVGSLVMGASDNVIRSLFLGKFEFMPSIVAFFAFLGGALTLGPFGIVTGPLIVGSTWKLFSLKRS